ncbi:MAG: FHA domain-containing protein [Candidatus Lindowbacteria bacterium]|nr:FHA domain-containing protein [Candidatus Lindowbacteria bacterium]
MKIQIGGIGGPKEVEIFESLIIGRKADTDLQIEDSSISGKHLLIRPCDDGVYFEDLGSTNGTFLDDQKMDAGICGPDETIRVGNTTISIVVQDKEEFEVLMTRGLDEPLNLETSFDRILFQISLLLASERETKIFFERTLDILREQIPFLSSSGIILWNDTGSPTLVVYLSDGKKPTLSRTVMKRVMSERIAVLMSDLQTSGTAPENTDGGQSLILSGVESLLAAPIVKRGEIIGVLQLEAPSLPFVEKDVQSAMVVGNLIGAVIEGAEVREKARKAQRDMAILAKYLSPDVAERALKAKGGLKLGGDARDVTVFFSDIRGFTSLTERLPPEQVVEILNRLYGKMVPMLFSYKGMLDKFIGDAIMAVFGAPFPALDDAARACRFAVEALKTVNEVSDEIFRETGEKIEMGFGLASGRVISGDIGWEDRKEYTSIGDAVNTSSRLVGIARPGEILIDAETVKRAGNLQVEDKGFVKIRGKSESCKVFSLLGIDP